MKILLTLLLSFWCSVQVMAYDINKLRTDFEEATKKENACKNLIQTLNQNKYTSQALYFGYLGSANVMMAIYVTNPLTKYNYFQKGKNQLEKAISLDKNNVELLYLRFAIQTNVPSFLNYNHQIGNDRKVLLAYYPLLKDEELKRNIVRVFKKYSGTTASEKRVLNIQ